MKIICVGHITYDITFPTDSFPKENKKIRFHEKIECVGGPASTAAFLLGKWKLKPMIIGLVGNDYYGRKIKKEFILNNVNTDYLKLSNETETSHCFIIANRLNGSRTVLSYKPKKVKLKSISFEKAPNIILMDGYEYETSKDLILKYKKAISIIDAGRCNKEVIELAKMADYVVCSKEFAEEVTGINVDYEDKSSLAKIYRKMETIFKGIIVITLEAKGCLYKYNNKIKIMPSIKVKTVDSTGAGDIFHGAFVYGIAKKYDLEKILKISNIAGALSVTKVGGYKSIPSLEEMEAVYNEFN